MILVTGGTGLVGQAVLRLLTARGKAVTALVRPGAGAEFVGRLGAEPLAGVVEDPAVWRREFPGLEAVVHAAAIVAARASWDRFHRINVEGTRLAAQLARERGVPLVHISSVAVYGRRTADDDPGSVTEDHPPAPIVERDYYARSKRMAEEAILREADRGLRACSLRPCVIYGPGDRLLTPGILARARHGWLPRFGSGDRPLALVHSGSVALAVAAALESGRGWGRAYNVTGDAPVTANMVIEAAGKVLGRTVRAVPVPAGMMLAAARAGELGLRLLGPRRYPGTLQGAVRFWRGGDAYSSGRARDELGWTPNVRHSEALMEAFAAAGEKGIEPGVS